MKSVTLVLCSLLLGLLGLAAPRASAQPTPECRELASRFAEASESLDAQTLVALSGCVTGELGARAGAIATTPAGPASEAAPAEAPVPEASPAAAPPPPLPPNAFPSPAVPSPSVPSPIIGSPDESAATTAARRRRVFGEWPPPAPWVENWPAGGPWERP